MKRRVISICIVVLFFVVMIGVLVGSRKVRPDVLDYYVSTTEYQDTYEVIECTHFFKVYDYLKHYGDSVSFYLKEEDAMMSMSYNITGNQRYNMRIETCVPYESDDESAFSYIKVIDNRTGESWETKPVRLEADYVADYNDNDSGKCFYLARGAFLELIILTQTDRLEGGYDNPLVGF